MKNRNRWTMHASAIGLGLALSLSAVSAFAEDPISISYVGAFTANEWHTEIVAGAKAAVADLPFKVNLRVVGPSDFDPVQQATIFTREAQTQPNGMIVTNVASALFVQPAQDAQAQGITVTWTNAAPTPDFAGSLFVSADPKAQGMAGAKIVAKVLEARTGKPAAQIEGKFVVGLCVPGLATLENRIAGFRKGMAKVLPKVSILPTIETKPDRSGNFVDWNQAVQANRDALGFIDACEAGQQNIAKIIEDDKLQATSVAFDAPAEVRDAVARGVIPASVPSNHYLQAYFSTYLTAMALHDKKPMPKGWVVLPPTIIDAANVGKLVEGWKEPVKDLRAYFDADIKQVLADVAAGKTAATADYDKAPD
ncbi:sugar ABC transporter substrate-binding protein [Agrobacterium rhizogenes]|uniref:sugar ABC transporter substrate-binding protein n=1 Tax=Rhizobium rhizogenes TaxID=359 RepID=UPI001573BAC4|nr:sugar ABC transporter substrate-binding protein [Rhizobium rhizogenes]NTI63730.1 sugar ABC transporter substrate-binding protein [Rhizobium rhizogenes]